MVSVCMATHNGEQYIEDQLSSILTQLEADDEVIISDDGSTDRTIEIIKSIGDKRVRVLHFIQPFNPLSGQQRGMLFSSRNFENALKNAQGDIIILSDQDDVWYPEKVEIIRNRLLQADIVKHDMSIINADNMLIKTRYYTAEKQQNRNWFHLIKYLPFRGCCLAFRKSVLNSSFPFPKMCLQHDTWIGMIAAKCKYRFHYIDQPLLYHRIHGNNVSELVNENSLWYKVVYRFKLILQLIRKRNK